MKRVIPILVFLLILPYGQAPAEQMLNRNQYSRLNMRESKNVVDTHELGYITDVDQNNPHELPPVFRAFKNVLHNLTGIFIPFLFRFSYSIHWNPLLTDRPPPGNGK